MMEKIVYNNYETLSIYIRYLSQILNDTESATKLTSRIKEVEFENKIIKNKYELEDSEIENLYLVCSAEHVLI